MKTPTSSTIDTAMVEAVLFLENTAMSIEKLAQYSGYTESHVKKAIAILNTTYQERKSAVTIYEEEGKYILSIKKEISTKIHDKYKTKAARAVSKTALETLAIIAYSQPVTRLEIEQLRGANSDNALRHLVKQGFVKSMGKKDTVGSPTQYGTTKEFLRMFHLKSIKDLPKMNARDKEKLESNDE